MEEMEVDMLTSFSDHKLNGLSLTDDFASIVSKGFEDVDFCHLLHGLCMELKVLYDLKESPCKIDTINDVETFLYELSAFLMELECSIDEITVGSLEERFNTSEKRCALIFFIIAELKCARFIAAAELRNPVAAVPDKPLVITICNAMKTLGISAPEPRSDGIEVIAKINVETDRRLQKCSTRPTPIFTCQMDEYKWSTIDQICHQLNADCRSRNLLLVKRIDVTVNSFLWCERVRKKEAEVLSLFARRRKDMTKIKSLDAASLLAATTDILRIEQASSSRLRRNTHLHFHPQANDESPKDRGGRVGEMTKHLETNFPQQRGRGGNRRPNNPRGKPGNSRDGGYVQHGEKQTQLEYRRRYDDQQSSYHNQYSDTKGNRRGHDNSHYGRRGQRGGRRRENPYP